MTQKPLRFAYQIGAVGDPDLDDRALYREALEDAQSLHRLVFDGAWMVEHHFSDYYPQPNPLLFLSHIAAACPGLGLGTAVMVLPWYDPVRFAEDLSMLSNLSSGELHIGMGRGTAKSEYDAFGIGMETAARALIPAAAQCGRQRRRRAFHGDAFPDFHQMLRRTNR